MRIGVYPYKMGSKSARQISASLNAYRYRPVGSYKPCSDDFIINWGSSTIPVWYEACRAFKRLGAPFVFLNKPEAVAISANKLHTFRVLTEAGVAVPDWTRDGYTAINWIRQGFSVYARKVLTGHSGNGIQVIEPNPTINTTQITVAPLYVKKVNNNGEYRVHVFNGAVIDYQKKRRHNEDHPTEAQNDVRNLANGWIYARENLKRLERIENIAISAVQALGLDFGAVDIIKDENGDVFVLEVNTACGMSDTTLNNYITAIRQMIYA